MSKTLFAVHLSILTALAIVGCSRDHQVSLVTFPERHLPEILVSEVRKSPVVSESFEISNSGMTDQVLRYKGKNCSCASIEINGNPLDSALEFAIPARGSIRVVLGGRLPEKSGNHIFQAKFSVADDFQATATDVELSVTVPVLQDIFVEPASLVFSETGEKSVTVRRYVRSAANPATQISVGQTATPFTVRAVEEIGAPRSIGSSLWMQSWKVWLFADVRDEAEDAVRQANVTFTDGSGTTQKYFTDLTLILRKIRPIELPRTVSFGLVELGTARQRKLLLRAGDGRSFSVVRANSDSQFFSVAVEKDRANNHWATVTFTPDKQERVTGKVTFYTDRDDASRIVVDVIGEGASLEPPG